MQQIDADSGTTGLRGQLRFTPRSYGRKYHIFYHDSTTRSAGLRWTGTDLKGSELTLKDYERLMNSWSLVELGGAEFSFTRFTFAELEQLETQQSRNGSCRSLPNCSWNYWRCLCDVNSWKRLVFLGKGCWEKDVSELEDVDRRFAAVQLTRSWWEPRTCIRHCDFGSLRVQDKNSNHLWT